MTEWTLGSPWTVLPIRLTVFSCDVVFLFCIRLNKPKDLNLRVSKSLCVIFASFAYVCVCCVCLWDEIGDQGSIHDRPVQIEFLICVRVFQY